MVLKSSLALPPLISAFILGAAFWQSGQPQERLHVAGSDAGYVGADSCRPCHSDVYETYQHTGMARSFYRMRPEKAVEDWTGNNVYYHAASRRYYTMFERDGRYFQRRHQVGYGGKEVNVVEKEVHFVVGSGNRVRTYLHHSPDGRLFELPVSWYSEKGSFWAMSPGYDSRSHHGFQRRIHHGCMFCHNAYPEIEPGSDSFGRASFFRGDIPEGIDCQRCHGPGRDHVAVAKKGDASLEAVRASIQNPGRMSPERQMEVCMQCHLETTSARLPPFIHRYGRGVFSFRPGEELANYVLHFDHAPGAGHDDKFVIVNAAYRLRQSLCFQKSGGGMTCVTCHDPHDIPRGEEAARHYAEVCRSCHASALDEQIASGEHTASSDCLTCHMPKRRTDDVIHAVMTDHYIQRFKPERDLLAPLEEEAFYQRRYRGEVKLYYPSRIAAREKDLYLAVAQVEDKSNLEAGLANLERAIETHQPAEPEFYHHLGEAYFETGQFAKAIPMYEEALRRQPDFWTALHRQGLALARSGQLSRAVTVLERASRNDPEPGAILNDLALLHREAGRVDEAVKTLRDAIKPDPERSEAHSNLGALLLETGLFGEAETALREAVRLEPDLPAAHHNLATVLVARGDWAEAEFHLKRAIENNPSDVQIYLDYAAILAQRGLYERARTYLDKALELDPRRPDTHSLMGEILASDGKIEAAVTHFEKALELNPAHHRTHYSYGAVLALSGDVQQAVTHLRKATESRDPAIRQSALALLKELNQAP